MKALEFTSLDGHRFLAGEGPLLIVRLHEADPAHVRFELHHVDGNASSGGICPLDNLSPYLRAMLLRAD